MYVHLQVDPLVSLMMVEKVPDSTYEMVGGLDKQIKEIKEVCFPGGGGYLGRVLLFMDNWHLRTPTLCLFQILNLRRATNLKWGAYLKLGAKLSINFVFELHLKN